MPTITSANVDVRINIPDLGIVGALLQGFAADDAFTQDAFDMSETRMGVDGILSGGFTPNPKDFHITFQPDSPSIAIFDNWGSAQEGAREVFIATMSVVYLGTNKAYAFNRGFLKSFKKLPDAKKVAEPQTYSITWQDIQPSSL